MSELPEGWTVVPFDQVATYSSGRTPARATPSYWNGKGKQFPWVSISDMEPYGTIVATAETITEAAFREAFRERIVPAGTLLMSFKLTIGRVATLGVPACHNEAIISIYPNDHVDQRYLGYFLSQVDYSEQQDRQIKGNTLNQDKIDRIPVVLPPLHEQRTIARVLDRIREGIEVETYAGALASELKRSAMKFLLTRGLRGEAQKETEIGLVPETWAPTRLSEVAEVLSTRMSYSELELAGSPPTEDAVPVLGIKVSDMNRRGNEVELRSAALATILDRSVAEYRAAPPGTIIFPKRGAAIATNKKRLSTSWTVFDPNVIGVRPRAVLKERFLFHWFQDFDLRTITEPGPTPQLNKKNLEPLLIPVPPSLEEQDDVAAVLDAIDLKIEVHRQKRALLEELFSALLHKLMSGELRVEQLDLSALSGEPEAAA